MHQALLDRDCGAETCEVNRQTHLADEVLSGRELIRIGSLELQAAPTFDLCPANTTMPSGERKRSAAL